MSVYVQMPSQKSRKSVITLPSIRDTWFLCPLLATHAESLPLCIHMGQMSAAVTLTMTMHEVYAVYVCFLFVLFALEQPQFKNSPRGPLICHAAVPQSLISSSRLSTSDSELSDDEATCRIKNDSSVKLYSSPVGKPYRMECQVKKPCSACPEFRVHMIHMYLFYPILLLPTCQVRVCRFYVSLLLLFHLLFLLLFLLLCSSSPLRLLCAPPRSKLAVCLPGPNTLPNVRYCQMKCIYVR